MTGRSQLDAVRRFAATEAPRAPESVAGAPVVAVGAGKGGVGTSTVAALVAAALAADGRAVLLVDASEGMSGLHALLGVPPTPPVQRLRGGATRPAELVVPVAPGLSLVSDGGESDGGAAPLGAPERRILMRRIVALRTDYDVVILDAGASMGGVLAACAAGATAFVAVTPADRVGLAATYALVKVLHAERPTLPVHVVASRHAGREALASFEQLRTAADRFLAREPRFAGAIPDEPACALPLFADGGAPPALARPAVADAARQVAAKVVPTLAADGLRPDRE